MKINCGKVNNINKRVLAGTLSLVLLTSFSACMSVESINYVTNEDGYVEQINGNVSYQLLKECAFFKVKKLDTTDEYYTIGHIGLKLEDIFTKEIYGFKNIECTNVGFLGSYLKDSNNVKETYTEEELKNILIDFEIKQAEKEEQKPKEKKYGILF